MVKVIAMKLWNAFAVDICVFVGDIFEGMDDNYTEENTPNCQCRKAIYNVAPTGIKPLERKRTSFRRMIETVLTPFVSFAYWMIRILRKLVGDRSRIRSSRLSFR